MAGNPHVSVCIRAYRRQAGLEAAIASALGQTYGDLEVVVSDDSGQLEEVVRSFGDPRVRYWANPHPDGPAANMSRAVSLARGDHIAILNDDDRWLPGFLEATVAVLDHDHEVGIAFTDDLFEIGSRRVRRRLPFAPGRHDHFLPELLAHSMPASATLIRRAAWEEGERSLPLSSAMIGDALVWLRTAAAGWPFHYVDEPLAVSGVNAGQVTWSDERLPSRMIATFDAFRFEDPAAERLRMARVAEFRLARAHGLLRERRFREAWAEARRSRSASPLRAALALSGLRGLAIRHGASHPALLAPLLELWRGVRPPVHPG